MRGVGSYNSTETSTDTNRNRDKTETGCTNIQIENWYQLGTDMPQETERFGGDAVEDSDARSAGRSAGKGRQGERSESERVMRRR
jgi:hypothetical protein